MVQASVHLGSASGSGFYVEMVSYVSRSKVQTDWLMVDHHGEGGENEFLSYHSTKSRNLVE